MSKIDVAIRAIRNAAMRVTELRKEVDPGHVPMIEYLKELETVLRSHADELEARCEEESGGRLR